MTDTTGTSTETFITWFTNHSIENPLPTRNGDWATVLGAISAQWDVTVHEQNEGVLIISLTVENPGNEIQFGQTFRERLRTITLPEGTAWLSPISATRDHSSWLSESQLERVNNVRASLGLIQ